ncbi:DUF2795 domain-containing protein [Sphaerimonospora cavernae]|uniref:DUF2795 domain-containing protein n=1 Tax=Sphaerimonospora cavernae TaxID=1740611 RepID=A0ABV6U758_9ACTN
MTRGTDVESVRRALSSLDYPADKHDVVRCAEETGADEPVIRVLAALPLGSYDNLDEVLRSIPRDPSQEAGLTADEETRLARERSAGGRGRVAEHLREPR